MKLEIGLRDGRVRVIKCEEYKVTEQKLVLYNGEELVFSIRDKDVLYMWVR